MDMLSNPLTVQAGNEWPKLRKLIFVICFFAFVFQLYKITVNYYKYDTEFQTKLLVANKDTLDLPAITLCVERDAIFLKSALKKEFPEINGYLKGIENESLSTSEKEYKKNDVYLRYLERGLNIPKYFDRSLKASDFSECYLDPLTIWMTQRNWDSWFTDCKGRSPILESIAGLFGRSTYAKCFTFFSRQQTNIKDVKDLQVDMKQLEDHSSIVHIIVPMDKFKDSLEISPFFKSLTHENVQKSVFMFIHDSYGMPSYELADAIELKPDKRYEVRFWSSTRSLLKHPFRSNCYDYHKKLPWAKTNDVYMSKEQCIQDCFLDKSMQTLNCLVPQYLLLNDDKMKAYTPQRCHTFQDILIARKLSKDCRLICRQECYRTEYKFDYKESDHVRLSALTPQRRETQNFSYVHLKYKKDSDSEYRERPVHSLCASIQMMFMALLIWFGLSIFSFSSVIEAAANSAKPHMYYIPSINDRVSPSVVTVHPSNRQHSAMGWIAPEPFIPRTEEPMIKPKFTPTGIGSNVKLEHYNDFIAKVVEGIPNSNAIDIPQKKPLPQY